jgi:NADH:quinone reductase (non-electrogenic)
MPVEHHNVRKNPISIAVVGGGFAGLSALITLRKQQPDAKITLIDPRSHHLIITRLHETVHRPLQQIQIAYNDLAKRFNFTHIQKTINYDEDQLKSWNTQKKLTSDDVSIDFDCLLLATGSAPTSTTQTTNLFDLDSISRQCFNQVMERFIADTSKEKKHITVIGAGPSGIQFTFELAHVIENCHVDCQINVIDGEKRLLAPFPREIARYVENKFLKNRINLYQSQFFRGIENGQIQLEHAVSGHCSTLPTDLSLLMIGKKPPLLLHANSSGQVILNDTLLDRIFTAGDCSHYDELGSNLMTSQSAIRKGKAAANNILRVLGKKSFCFPYMHRDIGYILSLGSEDAIGWLGMKNNIISGLPAYLAKQASESQYDLLLNGIDSYVL